MYFPFIKKKYYLCIMNIHVFNPEHDIALAANSRFWTAPHAGRQLRADLGWLPALWANDGDVVIVCDVQQAENSLRKLKCHVADVTFVTLSELCEMNLRDTSAVLPWGWDMNIQQQLLRAGISKDIIPTEEALETIRILSGRETSAQLLEHLCTNLPNCTGEARVLRSLQEINDLLEEWGRVVLKSPWSSSGRGVRFVDDKAVNNIRWAEKVLHTQEYIMAERMQDKILDFGMEFMAHDDGSVSYEGLSIFSTSGSAYSGNILATEDEKEKLLFPLIDKALLTDVPNSICIWMKQRIKSVYAGPFGVDMMLCKSEDGSVLLDPCVEINLRRTMGHVALCLSPMQPHQQQVMRIGYEGSNYHFRIYNDHELLY